MGGALRSPNYGALTQPNPAPTKPNATQQKQCVSMSARRGSPTQPNSNPTRAVAPQPNPAKPNPKTTQQRQYVVGISRWGECARHGWDPSVFDMNLTKSKEEKKTRKTRRVEEKIPRAYRRITTMPSHRVAIAYLPLEVMRQAVQQSTE